ncbi:head-tail connector protein [Heyndrickxia sporothermodurans]|uniref:head-tail connector protein n=1 Tax=Heyndrickxia sporothermodurans TaxID=46224 RepID=UPI002DBCF03E|nr:head-tail connector protein [Heyndrickxia sporothermodurans]MEB6549082.1 head-tail connector protein [Heyndrickxia sporothermodurans]MED1711718.1 head-tail connector protein [Bacillus thuringiensis]
MNLQELKIRLKINDSSQDEKLEVDLEDAISYVQEYCHNDFKEGFPSTVKRAIALIVKSMNENSNVSSQSLGDMSKSFFEGATMKEAHRYLKSYRKARFL